MLVATTALPVTAAAVGKMVATTTVYNHSAISDERRKASHGWSKTDD